MLAFKKGLMYVSEDPISLSYCTAVALSSWSQNSRHCSRLTSLHYHLQEKRVGLFW